MRTVLLPDHLEDADRACFRNSPGLAVGLGDNSAQHTLIGRLATRWDVVCWRGGEEVDGLVGDRVDVIWHLICVSREWNQRQSSRTMGSSSTEGYGSVTVPSRDLIKTHILRQAECVLEDSTGIQRDRTEQDN